MDQVEENRMKQGFWAAFLAVFFPHRCMFCGKPVAYDAFHCEACAPKLIPFDEHPKLYETSPFAHCDIIRSVYRYDKMTKQAVFRLKFNGDKTVAKPMAACMSHVVKRYYTHHPAQKRPDFVIPVPMYPAQERKRGYNQSVLLAKQIAKECGIPCKTEVLCKIHKTQKQHDISFRARKDNLIDAFYVPMPALVKDRCILLVDDVCTSGSTFEECARMLKNAGAKQVFCLSFLLQTSRHRASYILKEWDSGRYQANRIQ